MNWTWFYKRKWIILPVVAVILYGFSWFLPPRNFPTDRVITIKTGQDVPTIAEMLKEEHVVRSAWLFTKLVTHWGIDRHIVATYYQFETPLSLFSVAHRLLVGESTINPVTLRFPEGMSNAQMARAMLLSDLADFDSHQFLSTAQSFQGYLFPSTYLVP